MIDRSRITERVSFPVIKLELKRALKPLAIFGVGLFVMFGALYYIIGNINGGIGGTRTIKVAVANATGVVPQRAEVRFLGVHAGVVESDQLVNGQAVLTITVGNNFGPIYKNAVAALRPNTPLEDMYVDITNRGTKSAGLAPSDYTIPLSQTTSPVNLSAVLNLFQPDVSAQLNSLLNDFGNGLQDRGADLRQAFIGLLPLVNIAGKVSEQLAVRAHLTKELVHNAAVLTGTLGARSTELHQFVTTATDALTHITAEGGQPLRQSIQEFPVFLTAAHGILQSVGNVDPTLNRTISALTPVADDLPSGLKSLSTFASAARPAVEKLQVPVAKLVPFSNALKPAATQLNVSLKKIEPQDTEFQNLAQAAADCTKGTENFFNWDASMSKWYDTEGLMVLGNFNFGFYTVPGVVPSNYGYQTPCAGGDADAPLGPVPTPKLNGPAPAP